VPSAYVEERSVLELTLLGPGESECDTAHSREREEVSAVEVVAEHEWSLPIGDVPCRHVRAFADTWIVIERAQSRRSVAPGELRTA
jgi:hypothetical protein